MTTQKLFKLVLLIAIIIGFTFSSCKRKVGEPIVETANFGDLQISDSFKFDANKKVTINFTVIPATTIEASHIIKIYNGDPANGGKLITAGLTDNDYKYSVTFSLPERLNGIYVENRTSDGIFEIEQLFVNTNEINHIFNSYKYWAPDFSVEKSTIEDPGCNSSSYDKTLATNTYTDLELDGDKYYIPAETTVTVSGTLTFKGNATLSVCGNLIVKNVATSGNGNPKGKIYITSDGTMSSVSDLYITDKVHLYNFGVLTINGHFSSENPAEVYNYEVMNVNGNFTNKTNKFENNGTLNISGNYINDENIEGENHGTMNVAGDFMIFERNTNFYNYCKLIISGNAILENKLRNYSYVKVTGTTTIPDNGELKMYSGSLFNTTNLTVNGDITQEGNAFAKVEVSGTTTLNTGSNVHNKIDLCDANGIETNNGWIHNHVTYCELTIPEAACNPGSNAGGGGGNNDDTDGDGVPDTEDDYPDDGDRAFDNYYPNAIDYSSLAYEDLWPGLGDYDFNDVVVDFQYQMVTNAENKIVDIITSTRIKAAGATLDNGFGIAIPADPANVESVSGYNHATSNLNMNAKGYENGHTDETVIILYDAINTIYNSSIFNTIPGGNFVTTDLITVTTTFSTPTLSIGLEPYNPFIYVDQERGKEIHLIDKAPTALASGYFGTSHDDSNPDIGRYYVTQSNLPWGIEIPESFEYPIEKIDVLNAYLKFSAWATSGGDLYDNWYLDEPGYREADNIYEVE